MQVYLSHRAAEMLSKKLKTRVEVAHVRIDFLNHLLLQGLYIEDQWQDTLLYAGEAQVRISDWFIFKDKPVLHYIGLENTYAHLYRRRTSNTWNYEFLADAFSTSEKKETTKRKPFEIDLKKVELENVRFHMDDQWGGEDIDINVGNFAINAVGIDYDKKLIGVDGIVAKNTDVILNEYKGGKPPRIKNANSLPDTIDTTPFNGSKWMVKAKTLTLESCMFHLTSDTLKPIPGLFDQDHLAITNVNVSANTLSIVGDTIRGNVASMSAQERCGIVVKTMHSKITVSPIASICEDLYLETNYSKVQNYYAMHYKRFPNFLNYIDSVTMVGHLKDAVIDERDIEYFAPQLKVLPEIVVRVSGDGKGTVANLSGEHLSVTDGNTAIKGNITMKGLPDIYKTYITFTEGELLTTNAGILKYAPSLKNDPDVAMEQLKYAWFRGKYEGYVENFAVNGTVNTNLGSIGGHIKLNIPGFKGNSAVYSGSLFTDKLELGAFFKQPLLGDISLTEDISGSSFDAENAQLKIDGIINEIGINGYQYRNVTTHGTVAKKEFTGQLLVDDPNLGLEFDGDINYANKNVAIQATAHLLGCNFNALHLTTDVITASADFDLKCTGSNIDNFSGYAKLNNIDMKRNMHKLALDSIFVRSTGDSLHRSLTVQSNDIVATIKGDYQLSKLPASFQYYLSRYLPNYIKAPEKYSPAQNFDFTVKTTAIDSILAVTMPLVRGFDSSSFSGSLNTTAKKLSFSAAVPFGSIGKFRLSNISVTGIGNLDNIELSTTIDNVNYGDSLLNGSLSLTTTIGNDSIGFTIATTSPDTSSSITLNGEIIARKDSLYLALLPSQFYLNQAKWDIAGGSKIVYSNNYLLIQGLAITSGLQKITASTQLAKNDESILINTENLDLGQLGSWAGLSAYQPDGRVNGTVTFNKIFKDLYISADIKASGVQLGTDTVGTINIVGNYDGAKKLISFDPQTGIFRDNSSVIAFGNISFDSATRQKLDGSIQFYNAPVVWASPFLAGVLSHLSGVLNGKISFGGSAYNPVIDGDVDLQRAGLRLDYMGCNYTIPAATIHIDNRRISFGDVEIFDSYKNSARLSGHFSHNMFKDMKMRLAIRSRKFEVMNLTGLDNNLFYGNLIASMDSFTIRGPFNDIKLDMYNGAPAAKSRIYIAASTSGSTGTYTYASFKTYGKVQEKALKKNAYKIAINIDANLNTEAEMHIVLDPTTNDEIMAVGTGNIQLDIPPNNDIHITGLYDIERGYYRYTYKKLAIERIFSLNEDSKIAFNGPFGETNLNVDAVYRTKARLSDLLTDADKSLLTPTDLTDAQTQQWVDVILHMNGPLKNPLLTFDIDLEDKHSQTSLAYQELKLINADDRQKAIQSTSLLLLNSFVPPDGVGTSTVYSGAWNNLSQIASMGATSFLSKITGDKKLNVDVKYTNYNYDPTLGGANRNVVNVGVNKSYFNDRLLVDIGSTSDWGKPTSAGATSNFNLTGDFRIQYLLTQATGLRLNCFRTSDYDVTLDRDIIRSGVGISWRKSFDNLGEFFRSNKYADKQKKLLEQKMNEIEKRDTAKKRVEGTK